MKIKASFDDGGYLDMNLAELMDEYDIDTVFYIPVRWREVNEQKGREPLTMSQLAQLADRFEIGSHTISHPFLTKISPVDAWTEISESRNILKQLTGQAINSFCYPRGYFNPELKKMVEEAGYENGRTTKVGYLDEGNDPFELPTTVHVGYDRKEYGGDDWLTYAKKQFKEGLHKEANGDSVTFHFWGHSEEINRNDQWERLIDLLDFMQ